MRKKLKSVEDLDRLRSSLINRQLKKFSITISSGTCGEARGSLKVIDKFKEKIENKNLKEKVSLKITGCHGFCEVEPIVIIRKH